ncbi:outer membrane lipoprotein carrier protein LolA [Alkalicaulis satelles]|uniref:Outer membrane lipoprotein carrier protein LolA n=1 Tax=Alkalicaulis satelles TaxID=2609175 RepID=A0A5M6ZIE6_9PROT|nr:outer-membrane lipoprotein carrier protein LolA [Alkalicaulis satelles]KAA5803805.1 outer membrane lipoprotein carrier protein LolA [Alkalicaulis satelles]
MTLSALLYASALSAAAALAAPSAIDASADAPLMASASFVYMAEPDPDPDAIVPLPSGDNATGEAERRLGVARAEAWFEGVTTLRARFEQIAPDGSLTTGDLALSRPGRARFAYDAPTPVLMVADGSTVAIADFDLETIDRAPIASTPLRHVLGAGPTLSESGAVTDAGHARGRLYVTLADPDGEEGGRLTLVFEDPDPALPAETLQLAGWYAVDAMGGLTEVLLSNVETGMRLEPRLFILDDEDVISERRRSRRR